MPSPILFTSFFCPEAIISSYLCLSFWSGFELSTQRFHKYSAMVPSTGISKEKAGRGWDGAFPPFCSHLRQRVRCFAEGTGFSNDVLDSLTQ